MRGVRQISESACKADVDAAWPSGKFTWKSSGRAHFTLKLKLTEQPKHAMESRPAPE